MPNLKMTLFENSISFFHESLHKAIQAESDEDKWKFAILLLVQAIETSLKERLRRAHEIFIYSSIDNPKHTVDLSLAIQRLEKIVRIQFNPSDIACIKTAASLRNQIVHFEFDLSIEQIKSNYVSLVGFYASFCRVQLNADIVSDLPRRLHTELLSLDGYVEELESRASERISLEGIPSDEVWECPACKRDTFVIFDGSDICYLCGHSEAIVECAQCQTFEFEEDLIQVDYGNMKGWEEYKAICKSCSSKLNSEEFIDDFY